MLVSLKPVTPSEQSYLLNTAESAIPVTPLTAMVHMIWSPVIQNAGTGELHLL